MIPVLRSGVHGAQLAPFLGPKPLRNCGMPAAPTCPPPAKTLCRDAPSFPLPLLYRPLATRSPPQRIDGCSTTNSTTFLSNSTTRVTYTLGCDSPCYKPPLISPFTDPAKNVSPSSSPNPSPASSDHPHAQSHPSCSRDVTLVTQVSLDRWARFAQQALAWGGPVSVAVYLPCPPDHPLEPQYREYLDNLVREFLEKYQHNASDASDPAASSGGEAEVAIAALETDAAASAAAAQTRELPTWEGKVVQWGQQQQQQPTLTVSVVHAQHGLAREEAGVLPGVAAAPPTLLLSEGIPEEVQCLCKEQQLLHHQQQLHHHQQQQERQQQEQLYPINALRNAALVAAGTSHVFLVDGDFIPSAGLREALLLPPPPPREGTTPEGNHDTSLLEVSDRCTRPVMWVVPAFELRRHRSPLAASRSLQGAAHTGTSPATNTTNVAGTDRDTAAAAAQAVPAAAEAVAVEDPEEVAAVEDLEVPDHQRADVPRTLVELAVCALAEGFEGGKAAGSRGSLHGGGGGGGDAGDGDGDACGVGGGAAALASTSASVPDRELKTAVENNRPPTSPSLRPFHCGRYPQPVPSIEYSEWWRAAAAAATPLRNQQPEPPSSDDPSPVSQPSNGSDVAGGSSWAAAAAAAPLAAAASDGQEVDARWLLVPYHQYFEPYGIVRKEQVPLFDERFRGYGLNKVQHTYHLAAAGFEFRLLTQHFCVTVPHPRSASYTATFGTAADPQHCLRVEKLYDRFKEEMYDMYGYRYEQPPLSSSSSSSSDTATATATITNDI